MFSLPFFFFSFLSFGEAGGFSRLYRATTGESRNADQRYQTSKPDLDKLCEKPATGTYFAWMNGQTEETPAVITAPRSRRSAGSDPADLTLTVMIPSVLEYWMCFVPASGAEDPNQCWEMLMWGVFFLIFPRDFVNGPGLSTENAGREVRTSEKARAARFAFFRF